MNLLVFVLFLRSIGLSCFGVGWNCTSQKTSSRLEGPDGQAAPIYIFLILDYFLIKRPSRGTSFFFWSCVPPWKRWGRCCLMGPACHPLWTMNSKSFFFLGFFFTPLIFGYFLFLLFPCRLGTRMSSSMYKKLSFLGVLFPLISGYFRFLLISSRIWNVETAAAKWDPHVILYVK
jgi:hypothetical protein